MSRSTNTLENPDYTSLSRGQLMELATELWERHQTMKAGEERREVAKEYNMMAQRVNSNSKYGKTFRLIH